MPAPRHPPRCLRPARSLRCGGGTPLLRRLSRGPHAQPLHRLQSVLEVRVSPAAPPRAGARLRGHGALRPAPVGCGHGTLAASAGMRPRQGPKLRAVPPYPGHTRPHAVSPGRADQRRGARAGPCPRPRHGGEAREPGHLLRARRRLCEVHRGPLWRGHCFQSGGDRGSGRARARGARGAHPLHHRAAQGHRRSGARTVVRAGEGCVRQSAHCWL